MDAKPIGASALFTAIGGINGFLAVAFGAFGAHGLKDRLTTDSLAIYDTGARYHMTHALALVAVALLIRLFGDSKALRAAGWLFTIGVVLFSGSLYALAISGVKMIGIITPFGGLSFLAGWASLAISALKFSHQPADNSR